MRGLSWIIRRQLITSFVLLQLFLIITNVNGGVIKREAIEDNRTLTSTEIVTEEAPAATTEQQRAAEGSSPLTIARLRANDLSKYQEKTTAGSTTSGEALLQHTTTNLPEIVLIENERNQTTELIKADVTSTAKPSENGVTSSGTDVPATKNLLNISRTTEIDFITTQIATTEDEGIFDNEQETTTEEAHLDYARTAHDNDSLPQHTESPLKVEALQLPTTDYIEEHARTIPPTTYSPQTTSHDYNAVEYSTKMEKGRDSDTTTLQTDFTTAISSSTERIEENTNPAKSTNNDIISNEIKNVTTTIKPSEKQAKQMKDSNMTLPDSPEVWALAGLKNIDNTKDIDRSKLINATVEGNNLPETNGTTPTKQLSDWTKIMKEVELNNSIRISPNSIENVLESNTDNLEDPKQRLRDQLGQGKKVISPTVTVPPSPSSPQTTSRTTSIVLSSFSPNVREDIVKTTPPIERNQVEDIEGDFINKKKIKIKDTNRNNQSINEEHNEVPLFTATEMVTPVKVNVTSARPVNILAKMVQEPTTAQMPTTLPPTKDVNPIVHKSITTTNPIENLVDAPNLTTSSPLSRNHGHFSSITPKPAQVITEGGRQHVETTTQEQKTTPTLVGTEASARWLDSSTQTESFIEDPSSSTEYSATSEISTTKWYDQYSSSSTVDIPSSTILTQAKPGPTVEFSTTTTEVYTTPAASVFSEATSSANQKTDIPLEHTTVNYIIDERTDSTTAGFDQFSSETSRMSTTTFISMPEKYATLPGLVNTTEDISTTTIFQDTPTKPSHPFPEPTRSEIVPKIVEISTTEPPLPITTTHEPPVDGMMPSENNNLPNDTDYNVIIAISVSVVGIIALILLVGFLYVMRKRQKNLTYGQRCRPVSLDAYSLDNVSIYNSVRRKGAMRASKRSYGNVAFDDPSLKHNVLNVHDLSKFIDKKSTIHEEFKDVPQIIARPDEVPPGCEDRNRYANVIPLPETRVILQKLLDDEKSEYINANYVRGPKDPPNYYIACQAPLESTVADFWRMIWEQNSRVIIMATDLVENGKERCAEYLPPSITIDNHVVYGDFQITLKNREVKEKYAVSTLHLKNTAANSWREITHFWYQWPETGVPDDEAGIIAMLLEARSCLKIATQEQTDEDESKSNGNYPEANGNVEKSKTVSKTQGPLTVHCSPGTGRTGTIIACDIALRSLETPKRSVDIPQVVYYVRRGRASAVQTKEQYEFIYRVAYMYATKISGPISET